MNVVNSSGMAANFAVPRDKHGFEHVVVVVKGTFIIRPDGRVERAPEQVPLTAADISFGEPGTTSPKAECDYHLRKPLTDVLLFGSAYAPGGRPVKQLDVTLEVGPIRKTVRVFGDRVWEGSLLRGLVPSSPEPFVQRELRYEYAFGGLDTLDPDPKHHSADQRNLVGTGFCRQARPELRDKPVPNQEDPRQPLTAAGQKPPPTSLGIVARGWLPRRGYAGTYDQKWLDEKFPFLPDDFDERHYQCAAEDQQCPHLVGGEPVRLTNLTPDGRWEFALPAADVPVSLFYGSGQPETELRPVLDTVILEPDARRVVLVWRASVRLTRKLTSIRQVRVGGLTPGRIAAEQKGKRYAGALGGRP